MNGADYVVSALSDAGIRVCFANPGTSEMHIVAALDQSTQIRSVLCLAEGVVTGAADGYARMADSPASTLLHLGPGLANGVANLHNAGKGDSAVVNIVGEHATYHVEHNAPLTSDIAGIANPVSASVNYVREAANLQREVQTALETAHSDQGKIVTLVLPTDVAWTDYCDADQRPAVGADHATLTDEPDVAYIAAELLQSASSALLLGGVLTASRLDAAARIAAATDSRLLVTTHPGRVTRGAGTPVSERIEYFPQPAIKQLAGIDDLLLVGAQTPVAFFAYPNTPSVLTPHACQIHTLAARGSRPDDALEKLISELGAQDVEFATAELDLPEPPLGPLTSLAVAQSSALLVPEDAVLVDESITGGAALYPVLATARRHDWLRLTGGAIGWGLPASVGAAVACPDRKVVCFEGDGSAMYANQALWTMARENLDITVVIFANRDYAILQMEYAGLGFPQPGKTAQSLMTINPPQIDFVQLGESMGVSAVSVSTAEAFHAALSVALQNPGPNLIEAVMAPRQ